MILHPALGQSLLEIIRVGSCLAGRHLIYCRRNFIMTVRSCQYMCQSVRVVSATTRLGYQHSVLTRLGSERKFTTGWTIREVVQPDYLRLTQVLRSPTYYTTKDFSFQTPFGVHYNKAHTTITIQRLNPNCLPPRSYITIWIHLDFFVLGERVHVSSGPYCSAVLCLKVALHLVEKGVLPWVGRSIQP